jgi:hypothetical protein
MKESYNNFAGDETKFIECDMLGHPNVLPCSSGLVWNESRLSCVYKFQGSGSGSTGTGTGTGTVTGGTGGTTGMLKFLLQNLR